MAIKAKDLRHKAGKLAAEQKSILEAATDTLTPEQEKRFDELHAEEQVLLKQAKKIEDFEAIDREEIETATEVERSAKQGDLTPEKKREAEDLAMREYLRTGSIPEPLKPFMKAAKAESNDNKMIEESMRKLGLVRTAQQSTTAAAGGYTIPQGFMSELEKALKAYGGMLEVSRIWKTSTGNSVKWPNVDDTANAAYLLAEAGNAESSAVAATFANQQFDAYKYTSGLLRISSELLTDSDFNMAQVLVDLLSERMGRGLNAAFTTADGSSKPNGVVTAATYGASFATQGSPSSDEIINLEHSVDPAYRQRGARWMFHDSTLKSLKKLKDSQNRPLFLTDYRTSEPGTLLGYNYTINQDMASGATNSAKIMLFGDFSKYVIRLVNDMRIVRLNERFADTDEVGFVVFFRVDGDLLDAGKHPVKYGRNDAT